VKKKVDSVTFPTLPLPQYMAKDEFRMWATPPWKDRDLLLEWLKRKYPATWTSYTIEPVVVTLWRAPTPRPRRKTR
jgi:hypothetical protein